MDNLYCERCGRELLVGDFPFCRGRQSDHGPVLAKTALFPFEGRHITPDGRPITIDSLQHLRRVEREYGVVLPAFTNANLRDVDPIKDPPAYRGNEMKRRNG